MSSKFLVLISGSPGTGKTSVAKYLNEKFGFAFISLTEVVKKFHLYSEYDEPRDTYVIDPEKLDVFLEEKIQNYKNGPQKSQFLIIEGHYADLVESDNIKAAFIFRCHPRVLEQRLSSRKYSDAKIKENIQAELLGNCTSYMLEHPGLKDSGNTYELRSDESDISQIAETILKILTGAENNREYRAGLLSWLSDPSVNLTKYLD